MDEIFGSEEFLKLEALCHARKLSFVVAVSKGGGGVHRPKKGPAFVMSDFFMYEIPKEWDKFEIRSTPPSSWINPKPLPKLALPLSLLATKPAEIKVTFVEIWDHFHGVLTETYFCPKLYLTRMPRSTVEKWMSKSVLPPGDNLSCADLVLFPAFVQWVRAATVENDEEAQIRLGFVALLIQLACSLYGLDPEVYVKEEGKEEKKKDHKEPDDDEDIQILPTSSVSPAKSTRESTHSPTKSSSTSPGHISCVPTAKLTAPVAPVISSVSPVSALAVSLTPVAAHSIKTVIPADVMMELEKIPDHSNQTPRNQDNIQESDIIEILDSPQGTPAKKKPVEKHNVLEVDSSKKDKIVPEIVQLDCTGDGPDLSKAKKEHLPKDRAVSEEVSLRITETRSLKSNEIQSKTNPSPNAKESSEKLQTSEVENKKTTVTGEQMQEKEKNASTNIKDKIRNTEITFFKVREKSVEKLDTSNKDQIVPEVVEIDCTEEGPDLSKLNKDYLPENKNDSQEITLKISGTRSLNSEVQNKVTSSDNVKESAGKVQKTNAEVNKTYLTAEEKQDKKTISSFTDIKANAEKARQIEKNLKKVVKITKDETSNKQVEEKSMDKRNVVETDNSNRVSDRKNQKNKLESKNITLTPEKDQSKITVLSSSIDDKDKSSKSGDSFKKNITKEGVTVVKSVEEKSAEKYNMLEINKSSKDKIIPEVVDLDDSIEGSDIYKAMEPLPKEKTISEVTLKISETCSLKSEEVPKKMTSSTSIVKDSSVKAQQTGVNAKIVSEEGKEKKSDISASTIKERVLKNNEIPVKKKAMIKKVDEKSSREAEISRLKQEEDIRNAVSESLGRLIQVVIKKMSQDDYQKFSRKVSKNLNNLDTSITDVESLKKVIDGKREEIQADQKNVFVHIKEVFDELKKYKKSAGNIGNVTKHVLKKEGDSVDVIRCKDDNANPSDSDKTKLDIKVSVVETKMKNKSDKLIDENEKVTIDNGEVNSNEIDDVVIVEPRKEEDKENENVKLTSNQIQVGDKVSDEVKTATTQIVEKLLNITASCSDKVTLGESGKRKNEQDHSTEGQSARKKICLTTISKIVPEKKSEDHASNEKPLDKIVVDVEVEKDKPADLSEDLSQMPTSSLSDRKEKGAKKVSEKHLRKLEIALKKCAKKIKEYEEKEVDWDNEDEEESNYVMTAKLKRRWMQIYSKIADAKAMSDSLDRRQDKRLKCNESRYPEINKKIEKFVNRTKEFPDFEDIQKLVQMANSELQLTESQMHAEAELIFLAVGKTLKRRRQIDDDEILTSYLRENETVDPATGNTDLESRLQTQGEEAKKKMADYLDNFYKENVLKAKNGGEQEEEEEQQDEEEEKVEELMSRVDDEPEDEMEEDEEEITDENDSKASNPSSRTSTPPNVD